MWAYPIYSRIIYICVYSILLLQKYNLLKRQLIFLLLSGNAAGL